MAGLSLISSSSLKLDCSFFYCAWLEGESGRIVNGDYWVTSAEGVTATGPPVITEVSGGFIYLPLILK